MKTPRIYISGPMTGIPDYNFPKFDRTKKKLERMRFEVISPADLDRARGPMPYQEMLRDDLKHLLTCDAIYLLKDWHLSNGSRLELTVAVGIGLKVLYEE